MLVGIAFYAFAAVAIGSALMVVAARNPVHSVLFLILCFFSSAGLFVLMGAEFLAMILVVVYVGAVAVLFLFVVMMLDIDFVQLKQGFLEYLPIALVIAGIILIQLAMVVSVWTFAPGITAVAPQAPAAGAPTNTEAIGLVLYTDYVYVFQASGLVLLVAMIGAIVLTLRERPGVKRQNIGAQVSRKREEGVELVDVKPGQGI
jgi:NADH-quinone oxidoreductase subunit J